MGRGRRRACLADAVLADHDAVSGPGSRRAAARRRDPRLLLHQPRAGPPPADHADGHRRPPGDRLGSGPRRPPARADHRRAGRFRGLRRPDLPGRHADRAIGDGSRDLPPRPRRDGGPFGRRAAGTVRRPALLGAAGVPAPFRGACASPRRPGAVAVPRRAGAREPEGRAAPRAPARGRGRAEVVPAGGDIPTRVDGVVDLLFRAMPSRAACPVRSSASACSGSPGACCAGRRSRATCRPSSGRAPPT